MVECSENIIHHLIDGNSGILPGIYKPTIKFVSCCSVQKGGTYGVTYWRIVVATRPPTPFNLLEK